MPWVCFCGLLLIGISLFCPKLCAGGEEPVVEEESAVIESGEVVTDAEIGPSEKGAWVARRVEPRQIDGRAVYIRHSSDAFTDPDQRMSLAPKYYFLLEPTPDSQLANSPAELRNRKISISPKDPKLAQSATWLATAIKEGKLDLGAVARWLDYHSPAPKLLLLFSRSDSDSADATLAVIRAKPEKGELSLEKLLAQRSIPAAEIVRSREPAMSLANWDFPKELANKGVFLNRLVALLKQVDGRYCVDFYGTNLNADADCRIILFGKDNALGQPVAIRFLDIPVRKESGKVAPVSVLAITLAGDDGTKREIGVDFPLCRPAIMEQVEKMNAGKKPQPGEKQAGPDLVKLVGEDLLEEFSRRIVNGVYR